MWVLVGESPPSPSSSQDTHTFGNSKFTSFFFREGEGERGRNVLLKVLIFHFCGILKLLIFHLCCIMKMLNVSVSLHLENVHIVTCPVFGPGPEHCWNT